MTAPFTAASALSVNANLNDALEEVCRRVQDQLPASPDLAVLFLWAGYEDGRDTASAKVCDRLGAANLIGCTGESILGVSKEVEAGPAVSLWAACMDGAQVDTMHLQFQRTADGGSFVGWSDNFASQRPNDAAMIVLGDPFSFPADVMLARLNEEHPRMPLFGGMASGGWQPGISRIYHGSGVYADGAVAAVLSGNVGVRGVVSQGCRPIGRHFIVTRAEQNLIQELGGKPALEQLQQVYQELAASEKAMAQQGLHLGRVVNELQDSFEQGDFLVRNVVGVDQESGAIAIGDYVKPGQTVQFHIRDAQTADDELTYLLAKHRRESTGSPAASLLFTCNGRGTRLFEQADHDAWRIHQAYGDIPLAGFFAQGEIGPIGGRNFLHGFTASAALFEARSAGDGV